MRYAERARRLAALERRASEQAYASGHAVPRTAAEALEECIQRCLDGAAQVLYEQFSPAELDAMAAGVDAPAWERFRALLWADVCLVRAALAEGLLTVCGPYPHGWAPLLPADTAAGIELARRGMARDAPTRVAGLLLEHLLDEGLALHDAHAAVHDARRVAELLATLEP